MFSVARAALRAPVARSLSVSKAARAAKPSDDLVTQLYLNELKSYQAAKEAARKKPVTLSADVRSQVAAEIESIKRAQGISHIKNKIPESIKL